MRPFPRHNLGKPRVLSRLLVEFLLAKRRCGNPTPSRISYNSCEFPRPFSFHVAREATLMLCESGCCQVLSATMYARDPRAYHHSSTPLFEYVRYSFLQHRMSLSVFSSVAGTYVHLPFSFMRQYSFAMLLCVTLCYINSSFKPSDIQVATTTFTPFVEFHCSVYYPRQCSLSLTCSVVKCNLLCLPCQSRIARPNLCWIRSGSFWSSRFGVQIMLHTCPVQWAHWLNPLFDASSHVCSWSAPIALWQVLFFPIVRFHVLCSHPQHIPEPYVTNWSNSPSW
jgi:hypothetical protein